jgi:DNA-binding HxlR family transcriptional regulator/putative sterol carrier protein
MTATRTYGEACATAHALDLVGERWALLVVRELLLGPKRFTDVRAGLPNASPNVISQRLRELEARGVVRRRRLGPPARAWVYELTDWGQELEAVIVQLGRWGSRSPYLTCDADVSTDAVVVGLRTGFNGALAPGLAADYELRLGDDRFSIRVRDGGLDATRGEPVNADAVIATDRRTLAAVLTGERRLEDVMSGGELEVTGDAELAERLLAACRRPDPAPVPVS